ncbi:MAG: MFS transporter [Desulfobacterales bacterium]|nr:MFS transporter [Desulfobacterales bacterium]
MEVFAIVWLGQMVSMVGSGLTSFVLGMWVYQRTGSVTQFAFIALAAVLPRLALSPLAGALVDRWDRRRVMILADIGAALSTSAVAVLFYFNQLEVWHIYIAAATGSAFGSFQGPAWAASVSLLVPAKNLGRANGMVQFGMAASEILAPAMAGVLYITLHVWGIILIDFLTFLFAVTTLLVVRFPKPKTTTEGEAGKGSLLREAGYGWKYIKARPGLLGLLLFFAAANFLWGMVGALITPMILNFTTADKLGVIISTAGCGLLAGSLIMSFWGGPKRRVNGVLNFEALSGFFFLLIGLRPSVLLIAIGAFGAHLTIAVINGSNQAIWQTKVAPDVQGRVFAIQQMISRSTAPLAYLLAGPLADRLFEPLLAPGAPLAETIGWIVGVGPGRGIGALFLLMGVVKILTALGGYLYPRVRLVEDELPDMITDKAAAAAAG